MSKRILAVLTAALLCVSLMALPVFASEETFTGQIDSSGLVCIPGRLPDGAYSVSVAFDFDGTYVESDDSTELKIKISNTGWSFYDFDVSVMGERGAFRIGLLYKDAFDQTFVGLFTASGDIIVSDTPTYITLNYMGNDDPPLSPSDPSISLSDVVDGEMVGNVLDSVVSLLPVVLAAIVGYIALRKGINFLRDVLHGA